MEAFALEAEEVLKHFGTDMYSGLSDDNVKENLKKYGVNELPKAEKTPLWKLIAEQFTDQLVQILLVAALISFVMVWVDGAAGEGIAAFVEPLVILLILVANAVVGVVQESNAEKAIEALQSYAPDMAKVLRNGKVQKIAARDLVPGDVIEVCIGDKVPADARVIEILGTGLRVDQSLLTGESATVQKYCTKVLLPADRCVLQDQSNMLFKGTTVSMGKARAVVVGTGINTAIGEIQAHLSEEEEQKTPLKRKLDEFGDQLARVITVLCVLVWIVNIGHFKDSEHGSWLRGAVYYFKVAVALAVAAIPEGLSVIITTCLALGTRKMARKNAIVRSLPSVETLGCTSVICSDKTGTLTTAEMSVVSVYLEDGKEYQVTGTSYAPKDGAVVGRDFGVNSSAERTLDLLSATCALCNSTTISFDSSKGRFFPVGEATEAALRVLTEKLGTSDALLNAELQLKRSKPENASAVCDYYVTLRFERLATLDFDRDRKSMSVIVRDRKSDQLILLVKGAPEGILERCSDVSNRRDVATKIAKYGREALRTLAFAYKPLSEMPSSAILSDPLQYASLESGLTFLGLAAMMDPPRPEIAESLRKCQEAGIRVIVLTGDNKETAEAIGKRIRLFAADEEITAELSLTGAVFDALSEEDQLEVLRFARLFSRVEPRHKSRLVALLQKCGHVVAMTGDGVNDAPALKRADIGIAMGSGTDVARAAADLVLVDDNFATIIEAVREGRAIYVNTKQFIRYLISSNIGEVACVLGTALLGLPEALSPVQLLWVNLVTDGLPATALGFNPHSPRSMQEPPRVSNEPLVGTWLFFRYLIIGCYVGFATIAGFVFTLLRSVSWSELRSIGSLDTRLASSVALSVLVVIEMFNALNALSETESLLVLTPFANWWLIGAVALSIALHLGILYVEGLASVFNVLPLSKDDWILVLALSVPVVLIDEVLKLITRFRVQKIKKD